MFRKLFYLVSWLVVVVSFFAPDAAAQDAAEAGESETKAAQRALIQQLGQPSYHAREQAHEELASQGVAAEAVLREALNDPDVEVRLRVFHILSQVREEAFEARLAAFIADVDGSGQLSLPGWQRFRELVGDSPGTRAMFAQMTRAEGTLLAAYETRAPEMSEMFATRAAWWQSRASRGNADWGVVLPPSLATLLLIGTDHSQGMSKLFALLSQPAVVQSIGTQDQTPILRTLLESFIASSGSSLSLMLAQKYDLEETGLQQAIKLLEAGTTSPSTLHQAIIAVGRFGGEQQLPLLQPLLDNKDVCHRWSNPALKKNGTINVEVRDAALVVLLYLTGKDPKQHGFELLKGNPETLYYVYTFGFLEDEQREAVHAKWSPMFRGASCPQARERQNAQEMP